MILLKNSLNNLYFNIDLGFYLNTDEQKIFKAHFSCILTSERLNINILTKKQLSTISTLFKSTLWVERELQEFYNINFYNLKDSRRLLTDYTYQKSLNNKEYKTTSFDLITQNIYIRMLHWFFYFLYSIIIIFISFVFYHKSLLHLLVLSEVLIIFLVLCLSTLSITFNLYYLLGLSILVVIFGGLELAINLLILTIKW